jgi:hypothetical protein
MNSKVETNLSSAANDKNLSSRPDDGSGPQELFTKSRVLDDGLRGGNANKATQDILAQVKQVDAITDDEPLLAEGAPAGSSPAQQSYSSPGQPPLGNSSPIAVRVPMREPWAQHEHLNPLAYTPEFTRAGLQQTDSIDTSDFDTFNNIAQNTRDVLGGQPRTSYTNNGGKVDSNNSWEPGDYGDEEVETELGFEDGTGTTRARQAFEFFKGLGFTDAQASGIIGNLQAESGPELNENAKGDSGDAWGIAQWNQRASRDRAIDNFERVIGEPLRGSSFEQQLEFIKWELENEGGGKIANRKIRALKDPPNGDIQVLHQIATSSASLFDEHFERSNGSHREKRQRLAVSFLNLVLNDFEFTGGSTTVITRVDSNGNVVAGTGSPVSTKGLPVPVMPGGYDPGSGGAPNVVTEPHVGKSYKTRNKPIQSRLRNVLNRAAAKCGLSEVQVYSGGQDAIGRGKRRTGSTRHDNGWAADVDIFVNGKIQSSDNTVGREKIAEFISHCVSLGARGIGHATKKGVYMGPTRTHIDLHGPNLAIWSHVKRGKPKDPWVVAAANRGLKS